MQNAFKILMRCYFFCLCLGQIRHVFEGLGLASSMSRTINIYGIYAFYPLYILILLINEKVKIKSLELLLYIYLIGYPFITLFLILKFRTVISTC